MCLRICLSMCCGRTCRQFFILLWKNWKLQSRKKCATNFEIGTPILFFVLLFAIRSLQGFEEEGGHEDAVHNFTNATLDDITTFEPFSIDKLETEPPGGGLWLQKWQLAYSPNNKVVTRMMQRVSDRLNISLFGE